MIRTRIVRAALRGPTANSVDAIGCPEISDLAGLYSSVDGFLPNGQGPGEHCSPHRLAFIDGRITPREVMLDADCPTSFLPVQSRSHDLVFMKLCGSRIFASHIRHEPQNFRQSHIGEGRNLKPDLDRLLDHG